MLATPRVRPYPPSMWEYEGPPSMVQAIGRGAVKLSRPLRPNFCQGLPPMGEFLPRPQKKMLGLPP